jgi:cellulose synthase/poly-beta-1,6-N-acetylglucosamine synthase-like glycosyltransferase
MTELPFTSIIVPVFNGRDTIDDLLRSLMALNYPQERYEIIVVDNNSQDDTAQRVQQYPVKLLYERKKQSGFAARNVGVRAAAGEAIAFTDADCVAHPDWLRHLLTDFRENRWGGFGGGFESYQPRNDVQRHLSNTSATCFTPEFKCQSFLAPQSRGELLCSRLGFLDYRSSIRLPSNLKNPPTANVAYRRQIFDEIGYFDPRFTSGGDLEFAWRLQTQTHWQIKIVPQALIYHQHRADLAALANQYRKNGWGYGLHILNQALKCGSNPHVVARQMAMESLILIGLSTANHALAFGGRLARSLFRRPPDTLYLKTPLLTMLGSVNFYYGRLVAARKGNKWLDENSSAARREMLN